MFAKFDDAPSPIPTGSAKPCPTHKAGETVALVLRRDGKDVELKVKLASAGGPVGGFRGWDDRNAGLWKKDVYHLAIVSVEYPDAKHNDKIAIKDWQESLFSSKTYNDHSVTGQKVYGSLHDFYQQQSYGDLDVRARCSTGCRSARSGWTTRKGPA